MKILAIETSTMLGGAAIMDDSIGLIAEIRLNVKSTHSERLMTEIDNLLKQSLLEISEIDAFAISIGPGSFTGLRIGLSTVKGLSFATGKPVVSVSTLEAFAWNFPFCKYPVCLLLDARKKEVYTAVFKWTNRDLIKISSEKVIGIKQLLEDNIFSNSNILFAGEGSLIYKEEITKSSYTNKKKERHNNIEFYDLNTRGKYVAPANQKRSQNKKNNTEYGLIIYFLLCDFIGKQC